ncbi:MAG: glutathione S-transferase family protein [Burkholderiales bacterium]|nr:glutathione S-transferase family protein [Burkholderiales bacterium]
MKLYYHPVSTTSRPIVMLADEAGIALELEVVDLFSGAHLQPPFAAINPSRQVPVLEDGDFRLTESSAILKYVADQAGSPTYPREPRARARVNERMDWFNTGLYRDLGYGVIYPQCLPTYKRPDERVQAAILAWGREKSRAWLQILDADLLAGNAYVGGEEATIADFFGACILTLGEVVHLDYSTWPNVVRWLDAIKSRPSWAKANAGFYAHFVAPFEQAQFEGLR